MEDGKKKGIIDNLINFVFKKRNLYLILILLVGLVLRIILAANAEPLADEMNVGIRSIDVHKSGTMNSIDQSHSFYFLNEIAYKLFGGINLFTARFTSVFFGILSILMIYLIVMKLYKNEKIAIVSAFLAAISGFQIRYSLAEMDITMAFFVLLSSYMFLIAIYDSKNKMYYLSALFLALAIAVKTFAVVWGLSYIAFYLYYCSKNKEYKKEYLSKKGLKIVIICFAIVLIFLLPTIISNYLLYKDKGIVDLQVARFLNINKGVYAGLGGIDSPFMLSQLVTGMKAGFSAFWRFDALISILAVLGFIITFKKYKDANIFLFFWFIFAFLFIAGTAWLDTHFVFNTLIFSVFASLFLVEIDTKISEKTKFKKFLPAALIILLVFSLFVLSPYLTSKTAISKMRSFAVESISGSDLVIADQRIYRGRTAFMFNDKAYAESENINMILSQLDEKYPGMKKAVKTYFIECIPDDCGWGTIAAQPDLNQSVESMVMFFKNNSRSEKIIYGGGSPGEKEQTKGGYFRVYETTLNINPLIIDAVKQTHSHYFYPVGWEGEVYDRYSIHNRIDGALNNFGFFIFYITIALEALSPLALIWLFRRNKKA
ncbi:glycosyltransferase family 39 protein [Candidatus Pacearchaeota archaeon]|nr:glycosyltransferase family 39 protein [Candidatus Pacearchaeota archaeon]